jgi:hypothetical protein
MKLFLVFYRFQFNIKCASVQGNLQAKKGDIYIE